MKLWLAARDYLSAHPRLTDTIAAGLVTVSLFGIRLSEPLPAETGRGVIVAMALLAQSVPLLWHRSLPWLVLAVVSAGYLTAKFVDTVPSLENTMPMAFATYVVARQVPPPASAGAIVAIPVVTVLADARDQKAALDWFGLVTLVAITIGIWLIGVYQRRIKADAERLRDLAVAVERARIAHDLHDLVAHHISAIAMQAKVNGLSDISAAADTALTEMRRLLRLLADDGPAELRPEPSLRYLDNLTDGLASAGFRVKTTITPAAAHAPAAAQAAVYWVVREALTNVLRHAGPTDIVITVAGDDRVLTATVDNGPPAADHTATQGSGLGLVGMRERVRLYDGTLTAGPRANGGWRVAADFHLGNPA